MDREARAVRRPGAASGGRGKGGRKGAVPTSEAAVLGQEDRPVSRRLRRSEAKNAAILDAALTLFSRLGLHGTTVEQIAEAAELSKTNLFYYFPTKEDVYIAVLRRLLAGWLAPLRAVEVEMDPVEAMCGYIRRKVEFSRDNPAASRLFCLEIVQGAPLIGPELRTSLKELVEAKAAVIRAWIEDGRLAPVDPYHLIFAVWSTTQHYADFATQAEGLTGRSLAEADYCAAVIANIQRMILDGIRPGRPGSAAEV